MTNRMMLSTPSIVRSGLALAGPMIAALALTGCGPSATDDAPDNLSSMGSTPSGIGGADTTGDRTDSLKYQGNAAAGGDTNVSRMGTGAGSIGQSGAVEGGQQNPDAAAPVKE